MKSMHDAQPRDTPNSYATTEPGGKITRTVPAQLQVNDIVHFNVDDSKEALVPLLELALVEDLDGNHRGILDRAGKESDKTVRDIENGIR